MISDSQPTQSIVGRAWQKASAGIAHQLPQIGSLTGNQAIPRPSEGSMGTSTLELTPVA